jgi:hypothetical protein
VRRRRGGGEEGGEESGEGEALTCPYPQLAWSLEQRQSHYSTVAQCISSCRTGAPLRIELQLLQFRNRRGALRIFLYFSFLPAAFFGAPPPMKDIVRHKALQSRPAQRKKLLQQRAS